MDVELRRIAGLMEKWIGDVKGFRKAAGDSSCFKRDIDFATLLYQSHRNTYGTEMDIEIIKQMDDEMCGATYGMNFCVVSGGRC